MIRNMTYTDRGIKWPLEGTITTNWMIRIIPKTKNTPTGFDFDVMHPYMIKSFEPFFNKGSLLELGSFKGDFTRRFLPYFDDVTCVEASDVAIEEAQQEIGRQGEVRQFAL